MRQMPQNKCKSPEFAPRFPITSVGACQRLARTGVVVIWPYQVGGDVEHKRRLLYNAVTRAKRWCNIIVQSQNILGAAPFA
ncbi:hypothetical protein RPD_3957 [Rhodopseudomonas palustris BisB5]|uniref:UvrD-like helicase C-terminal domain-containing protein n=1 Tax=Rhodopseudomonas palustris (strain BisB5) TaxID=316057 RepID=Q131R3_RHOPS|nr:hypothetical protein RPD_3957 [Rhodopseudomonas palustris BisB5]